MCIYARDVRWYVAAAFEGLYDIVIGINLIVAILGSLILTCP